jgi:hypothetical protein
MGYARVGGAITSAVARATVAVLPRHARCPLRHRPPSIEIDGAILGFVAVV